MPHSKKPSELAVQYAEDVVAGREIAGKYIHLACQRFLDDRIRAETTDWEFEYIADKADAVVNFQQTLPHTKGRWAAKSECLVYQPWQCFI